MCQLPLPARQGGGGAPTLVVAADGAACVHEMSGVLMNVSRREALGLGALSVLGVAGLTVPFGGSGVQAKSISTLAARNMPKPYAAGFVHPPVLPYTTVQDANGPYRLFTVSERQSVANILPGLTTPVYGYNGSVPGPIVKVPQGTRARLRVRNQLPATGNPLSGQAFNTSTHLHGSASLPQYDGYANDVTEPGEYKDYLYPNWQPARTLWYHDHNVMTTAQNAYSGLAAQYHLSDEAERALLPQGSYDVAMTVSDAMFAADGKLAYEDNSHSGLWGDVVLVNGQPWPVLKVKPKIYRFRVLNASISRSYRFKLSNGAPLNVVATDGGLMPRTQPVTSYRHAGAERYEVLIDFSKYPVGTTIDLTNLSNPNNVDYDHTNKVMRFVVSDPATLPADQPGSWTPSTVPTTLVASEAMGLTPAMATNKAYMRLERTNGQFAINGRTWHDIEASGFTSLLTNPRPDEVGLWTIENSSGGWFHPLHIHLIDFQIVSRNGVAPFAYEKGPKDVVYVGEGETVKVLMKFTLNPGGGTSGGNAGGRYMVHCHNLPHEDHDMMTQFAVGDPTVNDPIAAAVPQPDSGAYADAA
ncbi:multicopper oxidase family protein [Cellulomonas aerilata]|uniref:multicopper oxidase family protein n=1 Tax=Cellulomonas aerilata TaxID=515326 RepID=UPI001FEB8A06|nr:multicopper oxidase domain-containing protein [Cellulomonas aerilata]